MYFHEKGQKVLNIFTWNFHKVGSTTLYVMKLCIHFYLLVYLWSEFTYRISSNNVRGYYCFLSLYSAASI